MSKNKFYITTPIYYVNAQPHLGTLYSTLLADIFARWHRFAGKEVFFLTGTDEHGQKIAEKAAELQKSPKELTDSVVPLFKQAWEHFGISYDYFIRTTDEAHKAQVVAWIKELQQRGDIYKGTYTGLYCTPCETFVPEGDVSTVEGATVCPTCRRAVSALTEENYFFRLSAYQERLLAFYEAHPEFISPKERFNEVLSFVKSGLKDLSISRRTVSWGIPFPGDEKHVVYVWGDALMNYVSALGFMNEDKALFEKFWPADVQVMAKDIVRFHAVYFPAFLMAIGVAPAHRMLVHGYILVNNDKMSKSKGNAFSPYYLADLFGVDQLRYYLARYMVPGRDGNFDFGDVVRRINSDLANGIGNALQRVTTLAEKYDYLVVHHAGWSGNPNYEKLKVATKQLLTTCAQRMDELAYHEMCSAVLEVVGLVNEVLHLEEPWKQAKTDRAAFERTIGACAYALHAIAHCLQPVMPHKMKELLSSLGVSHFSSLATLLQENWNVSLTLKVPTQPLFARIELPTEEVMSQPTPQQSSQPASALISIDDVMKVELIVGTIFECEPVEKSDKLYRLQVDLGSYGKRQVLAGIRKYLTVDQLLSKKAVFVANLAPRKMLGLESQGMILFAKNDETNSYSLTTVDSAIANGTRLS